MTQVWGAINPAEEREAADAALSDADYAASRDPEQSTVAFVIARGFAALVHELRAIHGDLGRTTPDGGSR